MVFSVTYCLKLHILVYFTIIVEFYQVKVVDAQTMSKQPIRP